MDIEAQRGQRLFQAVVAQALIDATEDRKPRPISLRLKRRKHESTIDYRRRRNEMFAQRKACAVLTANRERDEARNWLLNDKADFPLVVSLAGYNPDDIRERARKLDARGWVVASEMKLAA